MNYIYKKADKIGGFITGIFGGNKTKKRKPSRKKMAANRRKRMANARRTVQSGGLCVVHPRELMRMRSRPKRRGYRRNYAYAASYIRGTKQRRRSYYEPSYRNR